MASNIHQRLQRAVVYPLGGVLLLVVFLGALLAYFLGSVRPEALRYSDGQTALDVADQAMVNEETGLRGWLLTANVSFLQPYQEGTATLAVDNAVLEADFGSDPATASEFRAMTAAGGAWTKDWAQPASGPPTASTLSVAFLDRGKALFDAYRAAEARVEATVTSHRTSLSRLSGMLLSAAFVLALVVLVGLGAFAIVQARRLRHTVLDPVAAILATTERLIALDLTARVPLEGPDEFRRIAASLNALASALAVDRKRLAEQQRRELDAIEERVTFEERQRLARDLHDSIQQTLYSIVMQTKAAELAVRKPGASPQVAEMYLHRLQELSQGAFAQMRALVFELRPGALQDEGLVSAIRKQAQGIAAREGIEITVEAPDEGMGLDAPIEDALYRILQESLHNVTKHAAADRIDVVLCAPGERADGLVIEVADDGRGFDPGVVPAGHLGLASMAQRAEALGGRIEVVSRPGSGTRVRAYLAPRPAPADGDLGAAAAVRGPIPSVP